MIFGRKKNRPAPDGHSPTPTTSQSGLRRVDMNESLKLLGLLRRLRAFDNDEFYTLVKMANAPTSPENWPKETVWVWLANWARELAESGANEDLSIEICLYTNHWHSIGIHDAEDMERYVLGQLTFADDAAAISRGALLAMSTRDPDEVVDPQTGLTVNSLRAELQATLG